MTCLSVQPHNPLIFLPSLLYLSSPPLLPSGLLPWTQESLEWVTCASTLHCRKSPVTCSRAANTCGMSLKSESGGSRVCVCVCVRLCVSLSVSVYMYVLQFNACRSQHTIVLDCVHALGCDRMFAAIVSVCMSHLIWKGGTKIDWLPFYICQVGCFECLHLQ